MRPNVFHFTPAKPCATRAKPMVAPTILCVPDTGSLKNVATRSHTPVPVKALSEPAMASSSVPLKEFISMIPFLTVSETKNNKF